LAASGAAYGASAGITLGFDPTGLFVWGALTQTAVAETLDLRAQVAFTTSDAAGLLLATASVVAHPVWKPLQPFAGLGVGAAITPPPFASGLVLEAVGGLRVLTTSRVSLVFQARWLFRWSDAGVTSGPLFEAGIEVRF